jgi:CheY-like chemotaxis protein
MTKIMLVEDDKSLREIYGVRLLAEGYDIVSAGDGEEALAMAIKERPILIVSDVMMPKISGFDMLDILRSTTETKDIKVIMMTALSSEEQRARGQALGADRYLVKSQVGIEDVVRVVHEVLGDNLQTPQPAPQQMAAPQQPAIPAAQAMPVPQSMPMNPPMAAPPQPQVQGPQPAAGAQNGFSFQSSQPAPNPSNIPRPTQVQPPHASSSPKPPGSNNRVIQPLSDLESRQVDINELLDKELAKEAGVAEDQRPAVETTEQEKAAINDQIEQFAAAPAPSTPQGGDDNTTSQHVEISPDGTFQPERPVAAPPAPQPPAQQPAPQPPAVQQAPAPVPGTTPLNVAPRVAPQQPQMPQQQQPMPPQAPQPPSAPQTS